MQKKPCIKLFDQRAAIARALLKAWREYHAAICPERWGKEPELVMIGLVIFEGVAKGHPRTASEISRLTGVSRARSTHLSELNCRANSLMSSCSLGTN